MAKSERKTSRLHEKIKIREYKLNALLRLTRAINNNAEVGEMIDLYQEVLSEELGLHRLILFAYVEEEWMNLIKKGVEGDYTDLPVKNLFSSIEDIQSVPQSMSSEFPGLALVIPVFHNNNPLAYLVAGDQDEEELKVSSAIKHMNFLQTLTNILVVAIENRRLSREYIQQVRMNRELELAAEMQTLLVSKKQASNEHVEYHAVYQPHQQIGGDYYDVMSLRGGKVAFCLGDVSGKGVSAAFLMANFQAYLRALLNYTELNLREVIGELNNKVNESVKGERFITFFLGVYDPENRSLEYVNAGHLPPLLIRKEGMHQLDTGTVGLGMLGNLPFVESATEEVREDDLLVLYTDGVTEVENEDKAEFGIETLGQVVSAQLNEEVRSINSAVVDAVERHRGSMPYIDDTTLLTLRFK